MTGKDIKKRKNILLLIPLLVVLLLFSGYWAFRSGKAQRFLCEKVSSWLSETLHTRVEVKGIDYSFWNKIVIEKLLIEDQKHDTLFYSDRLAAALNGVNFRMRTLTFSYFKISGSNTRLLHYANGKNNYDFIVDLLKQPKPTKPSLWGFSCLDFRFGQSRFCYKDERHPGFPSEFNFSSFNVSVSTFAFYQSRWICEIRDLSFKDASGFRLKKFSTMVSCDSDTISLRNVLLSTDLSNLRFKHFDVGLTDYQKKGDWASIRVKANIEPSQLSFAEMTKFIPAMKGMNLLLGLSGEVSGRIGELKGHNMELSFGRYTKVRFGFYSEGLPNLKQTFFDVNFKKSVTHLNDVRALRLPNTSDMRRVPIPADLIREVGIIHYMGKFTGYLSDFVAYGNVTSGIGNISSDLSFKPMHSKDIKIKGHLKATNLAAGRLLKSKILGKVSLNGQLDGILTAKNYLNAKIGGQINSLEVNRKTVGGIALNGIINHKLFNGTLTAKDPNLDFGFKGKIDYSKHIPEFNFTADVHKLQIGVLGFSPDTLTSLSCFVQANFVGNNIDNFSGDIQVKNSHFVNKAGSFQIDGANVYTRAQGANSQILLSSDFADAKVVGDYNFGSLVSSCKRMIIKYLPSCPLFDDPDIRTNPEQNHFSYSLTIKNSDPITKVLLPKMQFEAPVVINGYIYEDQNDLNLNAVFPKLKYEGVVFKDLVLNLSKQQEKMILDTKAQNITYKSNVDITNFTVRADAAQDSLNVKLFWNNWSKPSFGGDFMASTLFRLDGSKKHSMGEINIHPSKIFIADSVWRVNPGVIKIDSMIAHVSGLSVQKGDQQIMLNGDIANDKDHQFSFNVKNLNLAGIDKLLNLKTGIGGTLNGMIGLHNIFKRPILYSDLQITDFSVDVEHLGNLSLVNKWDAEDQSIYSRLLLDRENHKLLDASGSINPDTGALDYVASLSDVPTTVLTNVLSGTFSNLQGTASGKVHVGGNLSKLLFNGALYGNRAGLKINVLQVPYTFSDSVHFVDDKIVFNHVKIYDPNHNSGILNGTLRHDNFANMDVNLSVTTDRLMVLNSTEKDFDTFYGKAYIGGKVIITGHDDMTYIGGYAKAISGTNVTVSLAGGNNITENSFVRFVQKQAASQTVKMVESDAPTPSNVEVRADIEATPEAKCQIIFDSGGTSDLIKNVMGSGNLRLVLDQTGKFQMWGIYTIYEGKYNFSFKNVISKEFTFQRGGTIKWDGDPSDAAVDLSAVYTAKNVPLYDLFLNSGSSASDSRSKISRVDCKINLTDKLSNPTIRFDLGFPPPVDNRIVDEIKQYITTEDETNKQILSLMVLGRFYTPDNLRGTYSADQNNQNFIGTTASSLLSTQLSSWLSQVSKTWDVGVNYHPETQVTNEEVELALSRQILNDRVTINGNFGYNTKNVTNSQNNFIADFDLLTKLTKNGKLQFRVYNQTNNNLIYETSPTTQGIGFIYREDFNSFDELFKLFKSAIKKPKKTSVSE